MTNEEIKEAISDLQISTSAKPMTLAEFDRYMYIICEVIDVLKQASWVPVSKRLPEKTGRYLTYIINQYDNKFQYIMTCYYNNKYWYPDDECASDNVVAWMPLPEPYKEGEDESDSV